MDVRVVFGEKLHIGHSVQQTLDRNSSFHACQMKSQTGVFACGKGDVWCLIAKDVEFLGAFPTILVSIR